MIEKRIAVLLAVTAAIGCAGCTTQGTDHNAFDPDAFVEFDLGNYIDGGVDMGIDVIVYPDAAPRDRCRTPDAGPAVTLGTTCAQASDCDDGCFCNGVELCTNQVCVSGATACADSVACTVDSCVEEVDRCFFLPEPAMCQDGNACNGAEVCDPHVGCMDGSPLYCNDENACTVDSCDDTLGCVFAARDLDRDGYVDSRCGGNDCDDDPRTGVNVHPGAPEVCDNGIDDNCDGLRDFQDPSCLPTNDTCDNARMLTIPFTGTGTYNSATRNLHADYTLSCGGTGVDAVYAFTLMTTSDVTAVADGVTGGAIELRSFANCAHGPELRCEAGASPQLLRRSLPPGDYAIIVNAAASTVFNLHLRVTAATTLPLTDICDPSTVDISAGGTFTGSFADTNPDYVPACRTDSGASAVSDAVYRLHLPSAKDITITATTLNGSNQANSYLTLVSDCGDIAHATLSCETAVSPRIRKRGLEAGDYYVIVESADPAATTWNLAATIIDPVPPTDGDTCSNVIDLETAPSNTSSLTLSHFERESGTSCGGTSDPFVDAFFTFTLTEPHDVAIHTTATGGGSYFVSLQSSCGITSSDLRCRSVTSGDTQTFRSLAAGHYFVSLAGASMSATYTVQVTKSAPTPVPMNDHCEGAIDISAGANRHDTLIDFADDVAGGTCAATSAPDAFYSLTLTTRSDVSINVARSGGASSDPLYVTLRQGACGPAAMSDICGAGAPTAAILNTLDPGTYYLIVESRATTVSDFHLVVNVSPTSM